MILKKEVSMIFPSKALGEIVASEDSRTQCQVLEGFASKQLLDCVRNNQPIISLVAIMPTNVTLWFAKIYQEIAKQEKLPEDLIKSFTEDFIKDISADD